MVPDSWPSVLLRPLPDAVARRVVAHCVECLQRAGVEKPQFAAPRPVEGFERAYDTLVLDLQSEQSRVAQDPSPAELIREALLLLRALSYCPGYGFNENYPFWDATISPASRDSMVLAFKTNLQFPRVDLDWNPRYLEVIASLLEFDAIVTAVFTTPSSGRFSSDGEKMLATMHQCCAAAGRDDLRPIECVVAIRFGERGSETDALVDKLISTATALTSPMATPIQGAFTWTSVHMSTCQSVVFDRHQFISLENLRVLRWLCLALPRTVAFDFALPHSTVQQTMTQPSGPLTAPFVALISAAIGLAGTELLGRLAVLDLRPHSDAQELGSAINFASLCTILPLSRSLERLNVVVQSKFDLLWLAYAATHPLTPTTKWRALQIEYVGGPTAEWTQLGHALASQSVLEALWASSIRTTTAAGPTARVAQQDLGGHYVRRTAKVAGDVQFFSADGSETFVQVLDGCDVELCDTTTPLGELVRESGKPGQDDVAVVVAGVGLGWVHKRHLTELMDTRYEGAPRSSLTTLVLDPESTQASDMDTILALFGTTLNHLSAALTDPFPVTKVARAGPQLETLEIARSGGGESVRPLQRWLSCDR